MAGFVYHVLNRAVGDTLLFETDGDYLLFEQVLAESLDWMEMRILAYTAMPNHWHLVLWPHGDADLSEWMRWITVTHTQRWHSAHGTFGTGPIYQGRFRSFPVQPDEHLYSVCKYAEANAWRAGLVKQPEDWRWSSLWRRAHNQGMELLSPGPLPFPADWVSFVARPQPLREVAGLRTAINRGAPYGEEIWQHSTAKRLGLESSLRPRGRPRKVA